VAFGSTSVTFPCSSIASCLAICSVCLARYGCPALSSLRCPIKKGPVRQPGPKISHLSQPQDTRIHTPCQKLKTPVLKAIIER
jgi:hypothetical protein